MHLSVKTDQLAATSKDVSGASPGMRGKQQNKGLGGTMAPSPARKSKASSPSRKASVAKQAANAKKGEKKDTEEEKSLTSPTSISMASSFIIKNADASFDTYYHQMKRRKQGGHDTSFAGNTSM